MADATTMLTYIVVVLGLLLIPGPAVVLVLTCASIGGRRVGIATGLGIACGDLVHTALATFGLSAILVTSTLAFDIVKYAGVAYLLYLGIRAVTERSGDLRLPTASLIGIRRAFRQGVLTEVLNPKTAIFFLALLPQFVHPDRGAPVAQFAVLGFLCAAMCAAYMSLLALAAVRVKGWLYREGGVGRWRHRIVGSVYLTLGVHLLFQFR